MFKFMKSKKGFTLVELMIVVVIMAILVAVAVPIYNAVTENARKKTCATNRRNIVSQITNNAMSDPAILATGWAAKSTVAFTITTDADGEDIDEIGDEIETFMTADDFEGLFSTDNKPICPVGGGILKVYVTAGSTDKTSLDVVVDCMGGTGADHDEQVWTPASGNTAGSWADSNAD